MEHDKLLRQQLAKLIDWNEAHADLSAAVTDFPAKLRGQVPDGLPHSAWQLLEHIRIALWDILEFSRDAKHKSPKWPEGYWPKTAAPPSDKAWDESVKAIQKSAGGIAQTGQRSQRMTCSSPCLMATARRCCAKCCWSPTTAPITWDSWCWCAGRWARGRDSMASSDLACNSSKPSMPSKCAE